MNITVSKRRTAPSSAKIAAPDIGFGCEAGTRCQAIQFRRDVAWIDAVVPSIVGDPARDNVSYNEDFEEALTGYDGAWELTIVGRSETIRF